ncbi:unnamed protein product [Ilex paraguariensis]|uniref:Uncharacterized protein n=1 Tax=Ilex paraguariensis TaxID=185542 RepID=A0ABC8S076_9AQUA
MHLPKNCPELPPSAEHMPNFLTCCACVRSPQHPNCITLVPNHGPAHGSLFKLASLHNSSRSLPYLYANLCPRAWTASLSPSVMHETSVILAKTWVPMDEANRCQMLSMAKGVIPHLYFF